MTTPSGTIKFSDIEAEFGQNPVRKLGSYRVSQLVGDRNWPLDAGVPQSGTIRFSDLRNKTLNVVVDYPTESTRVSSGTTYDSSGVVIGGFKSLPARSNSLQTKKVNHLIRTKIGVAGNQSSTDVALRTNTWSSTTILNYIVTPNGKIYGRGGIGGNGVGQNGSPALGVEQNCSVIIESQGELRGGGGGGGQGGDYSFNQPGFLGIGGFACSASGGAGGTGRGYNNQSGSLIGSGGGNCRGGQGTCSNCIGQASGSGAGAGGTAGDWGSNACPGCNAGSSGPIGDESESIGSGRGGGLGGAAIIKTSSSISVSVSNNGTISGSQTAIGTFT